MELPNALYHITSCGDRRENIYEDDEDRKEFLSILEAVCKTYNWMCHAYCQIGCVEKSSKESAPAKRGYSDARMLRLLFTV